MNLLQANCELLQQGIALLSRHDDRSYNASDPASYGSGIGAHFRHVLDHYRTFLDGLDCGLIDYDNRERDTAEEKDLEVVLESLLGIRARLETLDIDVGVGIRVKVCASVEGDDLHSESSLGRELQFLVSHTVHHYALIGIASRMQGIYPEEGFGVAPSTLKYLSSARS